MTAQGHLRKTLNCTPDDRPWSQFDRCCDTQYHPRLDALMEIGAEDLEVCECRSEMRSEPRYKQDYWEVQATCLKRRNPWIA